MGELELKPCPRCGGEAIFAMSKPEGGRVRVECLRCGNKLYWRMDFEHAAKAWNGMARHD